MKYCVGIDLGSTTTKAIILGDNGEVLGRGIPRAGYELRHEEHRVGVVTSGAPSPTLGRPIGLGYVPPTLTAPGTRLEVLIRGRATPARVVETPFVSA